MVGNGDVASYSQRMSMSQTPVALNVVDQEQFGQVQALERMCGESLYNKTSGDMAPFDNANATAACLKSIQYMTNIVGA